MQELWVRFKADAVAGLRGRRLVFESVNLEMQLDECVCRAVYTVGDGQLAGIWAENNDKALAESEVHLCCRRCTQGMRYDEDAVLAATWLPALMSLPPALRHQPWTMTRKDAEHYGVVLGHDYPAPIIDPANQMGVLTGAKKPKSKTKNAKNKA